MWEFIKSNITKLHQYSNKILGHFSGNLVECQPSGGSVYLRPIYLLLTSHLYVI